MIHAAVDVGEAVVAALEAVGQALGTMCFVRPNRWHYLFGDSGSE